MVDAHLKTMGDVGKSSGEPAVFKMTGDTIHRCSGGGMRQAIDAEITVAIGAL